MTAAEKPLYHRVKAHPTARISPAASLVGDVTLGRDVTVFAGAHLRGDLEPVVVGDESNLQEGVLVHVSSGDAAIIGRHCTVGHGAIIHGCEIGDNVLVGMGAIVMSGAKIGDECVVAAGALVPEHREFTPRSLIMGMPARVSRTLSDEEVALMCTEAGDEYVEVGAEMLAQGALEHPAPDMDMQVGA